MAHVLEREIFIQTQRTGGGPVAVQKRMSLFGRDPSECRLRLPIVLLSLSVQPLV